MMTARQSKAARALLGWRQDELADAAGLAVPTVQRFEHETSWPRDTTLEQLERAFRRAGVRFSRYGVEVRAVNNSLR